MNYRRIYLDGYSYYLTLVTQGRKPLLVDNIELLRDAFKRSKQKYIYRIDAIVILPDHLHMILTPKNPMDYSKIIHHVKRSFVYGLDKQTKLQAKNKISHAKYKRGHSGIWQERFYEHTIRDEKDWLEKMEYIKHNPIKHKLVDNIDEWEYTSFKS
jgi:putative transposase